MHLVVLSSAASAELASAFKASVASVGLGAQQVWHAVQSARAPTAVPSVALNRFGVGKPSKPCAACVLGGFRFVMAITYRADILPS
eukprot:2952217-Pleurochrysis_carterae.AAC.1